MRTASRSETPNYDFSLSAPEARLNLNFRGDLDISRPRHIKDRVNRSESSRSWSTIAVTMVEEIDRGKNTHEQSVDCSIS